jgi:hypothetical protein
LRAADHVGGYETRDPILVAALDERVHLPRQKLAVQDLDRGRRHHRSPSLLGGRRIDRVVLHGPDDRCRRGYAHRASW